MKGQNALTSSARTGTGSDRWMTPIELVRGIEWRLGVRFVDDVAAEPGSCVCSRLGRPSEWTGQGAWRVPGVWDGLVGTWGHVGQGIWDRGGSADAVWCNPPYSKLGDWLDRCAREGRRQWVVALIPARTDTAAWHDHVASKAKVIMYLRGRVQFERPSDEVPQRGAGQSSTFPSAVVLWHPARYGQVQEAWDWRADLPSLVRRQRPANDNTKPEPGP